MSSLVDLLPPIDKPEGVASPIPETEAPAIPSRTAWNSSHFAEDQIRQLVRRVFIPGWPSPARQVVFCAVDESAYVAEICMDVAKALAGQISGSVCVVEANSRNPELESIFGRNNTRPVIVGDAFVSVRNQCQQISANLWLAPLKTLTGGNQEAPSTVWVERRLSEFQCEFDYTILHAPPAAHGSDAPFLARACDGVVLVLEAHSTRRATAQNAKEMFRAANARVFGAVLSERIFPIPDRIYRKL